MKMDDRKSAHDTPDTRTGARLGALSGASTLPPRVDHYETRAEAAQSHDQAAAGPLHDPASQIGGGHYRNAEIRCPHCCGPLQLWDVLRFTFFNEGAAIKHVFRHRTKNKLQDLLKAKQYIDKIIATEYPEAGPDER